MPAVTVDPQVEDRMIRAYNAAYAQAKSQGLDEYDSGFAGEAAEAYARGGKSATDELVFRHVGIPSGCDYCCGGATDADREDALAKARGLVATGVAASVRHGAPTVRARG